MRPVLVLQHLDADGPAYLGDWLRAQGIAADVRNAQAGDRFPQGIDGHSALVVLGGEMSANDPLPTLRQAESLILQAIDLGRPVLGHCLGGQLMARALGARVGPSPAPEVGWLPITVADAPLAHDWFGTAPGHTVFQWHYEAFDLPPGCRALASSPACPNQAFAIGPHLAMQFHVELDADKLARWAANAGERHADDVAAHDSVHSVERLRHDPAARLQQQHALADRLYARWWSGVPAG
jgi:GMP synthase-like glutamine amidotransferase